jgi:hypothetical protein
MGSANVEQWRSIFVFLLFELSYNVRRPRQQRGNVVLPWAPAGDGRPAPSLRIENVVTPRAADRHPRSTLELIR